MKFTKHNLKKVEHLLEELGYSVRYEKGNFQSGYCIVADHKIAVINKYFDLEGRINSMIEIIGSLQPDSSILSDVSRAVLKEIDKMSVSE
ncbi:MAG: hypothetical protein RJA52_1311 [Bacteroidota bacterium]|jgi:hypothetical protein